jgi:hypothetical protein
MRNIAKKFFEAVSDHAESVSAHHAKMSKAHAAMTDGLEKDSPEDVFHKTAMAQHADQSANWAELGETCATCASKCGKTEGDEMEKLFSMDDRLVPSAVSAIAPDAPRAIPRYGARAVPASDAVPEIFRKMVSVSDETEEG